MPEVPKVVVVTRTRNRTHLLRRAIRSVLGQSFSDWQHVIVNDGGHRKKLEALCEEFTEAYKGRLLLKHKKHSGMQDAANAAIRGTDSTYLVIHDDDDSWDPDFLQETVAFLEAKGPDSPYQGVISKTIRILEAELKDGTYREIERHPYMPLKEINFFRLGYENAFSPIAFLYRRSVHDHIGLFNPKWDIVADLDFNFRFLQQFEIGVVEKPLAYYHWRDASASKVTANTVTTQKEKHSLYLNELRHHYMRQASSAREVADALSFQVSPYLVENQWMTAEVRERAVETVGYLQTLIQQVVSLRALHDDSIWPKLNSDIIPRLDELLKASEQLHRIGLQLKELREFSDEALWPKLDGDILPRLESLSQAITVLPSLAQQIEQLHKFGDEALWPKLEGDILPRLDAVLEVVNGLPSLAPQIEQLQKFNDEALWPKLEDDILPRLNAVIETLTALPGLAQQLEKIHAFNDEALWPKLDGDILPRLQAVTEAVTALPVLTRQVEQLQVFHDQALWPKLDGDILPRLQAISEAIRNLPGLDPQINQIQTFQTERLEPVLAESRKTLDGIAALTAGIQPFVEEHLRQHGQKQAAELEAIREELYRLREHSLKQWQLGRLRIQWVEKVPRPGVDEQGS